MESKYAKRIKELEGLVEKHNDSAFSRISLIASGNVVSPRVLRIMQSDLLHRAAEGKKEQKRFPGLESFYEIESNAEREICSIFGADFAELRPLSGSQANMIVYTAITNIEDTIIVPSIRSGSHVSTSGRVIKKLRGYKFVRPKPEERSTRIDLEDLSDKIKTYLPGLLVLGGSVVTEWQDLTSIVELAHRNEIPVLYDASHTAGLIATRSFPNPLDSGIDLMTMTTCKTIPGPSHAWIMGKNRYKDQIEATVFPGFVSGGHLQEYVGSIVSLYEIMKYGSRFGDQIISNARTLGESLEKGGFQIVKTKQDEITETHQIIISAHSRYSAKEIEQKLAEIGILVNVNYLPDCGFKSSYGLRFGTQEVTRFGAEKDHIRAIGDAIVNGRLKVSHLWS